MGGSSVGGWFGYVGMKVKQEKRGRKNTQNFERSCSRIEFFKQRSVYMYRILCKYSP